MIIAGDHVLGAEIHERTDRGPMRRRDKRCIASPDRMRDCFAGANQARGTERDSGPVAGQSSQRRFLKKAAIISSIRCSNAEHEMARNNNRCGIGIAPG